MAQLYYRVQPTGLELLGHTSEGSDDSHLPQGYVYVYTGPNQILSAEASEWIRRELRHGVQLEVVELFGAHAIDPGDVEGVAVRPTTIRRRTPLRTWLERYPTRVLEAAGYES